MYIITQARRIYGKAEKKKHDLENQIASGRGIFAKTNTHNLSFNLLPEPKVYAQTAFNE